MMATRVERMRGEAIGEGLATGGKAISLVLLAHLVFRIFQWTCDFISGRFDKRQAMLDQQQALVDEKLLSRLRNLERQVATLDAVVTRAIGIIREIDPGHPGLNEIHALLARNLKASVPIEPHVPDGLLVEIEKLKGVE